MLHTNTIKQYRTTSKLSANHQLNLKPTAWLHEIIAGGLSGKISILAEVPFPLYSVILIQLLLHLLYNLIDMYIQTTLLVSLVFIFLEF